MDADLAATAMDPGFVITAAGVLHVLIVAVVGAHVLLNKQSEGSAFSWLGIVTLSPFFGAALYWIFGINRIRRRAQAELPREDTHEAPAADWPPELHSRAIDGLPPRWLGLMRLGLAIHRSPYLDGNALTPLINGDEAYPDMLAAIDAAEQSVVLSSYIFEYDDAGTLFVSALIRARTRGVSVRVLIDGLGVGYGLSIVRSDRVLRKAGVPTARFLSFLSRSGTRFLNLRNHRKILSVDGRVAFVGGMNIRAGNLLRRPSRHHTRDVHFRITGPIIDQINAVFAEDWQFASGEVLDLPRWAWKTNSGIDSASAVETTSGTDAKPWGGDAGNPDGAAVESSTSGRIDEPLDDTIVKDVTESEEVEVGMEHADRHVLARVLLDGPDDNYQKLEHAVIGAINVARRSIDVVTPYFLPGPIISNALQIASLRGVRVRVVVPSKNNLPFVGWAMQANNRKLIGYGIEIVETPPPFDHSKLFIVDDRYALVGSSNWDSRSLNLNFEINIECYDRAFNGCLHKLVDDKCERAEPVSLVNAVALHVRLRNNFFRLFSPYL